MKQLFLASLFSRVAELFVDSTKAELNGKKVTFIPTASIHEEVNSYVASGKKALEKLGLVTDLLEISTATKAEIERKIMTNDFIYVTGGNAFFLLKELRRTGADAILVEQIESGKPYIGESAGSIVLADNIEYAKDMDDYKAVRDLKSFASLAVVDFYPLPHYGNFPYKVISEDILSNYRGQLNIVPFSNTQAIVVRGTKFELLSK